MPTHLIELPFDQYQRYGALALMADRLRAGLGRPLRILDVGDWNGLAQRFCPGDRALCLDPDGRGTGRYLQGDGRRLPFRDDAFDLVACLDALEHLPAAERPGVVSELRRVAAHGVVIAAPVADHGAAAAERALGDYVSTVLGGEQRQLREHREHGLPRAEELRGWAASAGWRCADTPSGLLGDWLPMMLVKHLLLGVPAGEAAHRALDRRYNERHGPVDPAEPAYRQVLFAARGEHADLPDELVAALPRRRGCSDPEDLAAVARLLVAGHAARAGAGLDLVAALDPGPAGLAAASAALDGRVASLVDELTRLRAELVAASGRIRAFESGRFIRAMAALDRLRRAFRAG